MKLDRLLSLDDKVMSKISPHFGIRYIHHSLKMIVFLLFFFWLPQRAFGFDTGHHSDLTREALQDQGFGNTAIQVAQVENWLTDYFSSSPTSSIKSDVEKLHFDNLLTTTQVRNYWGRLTLNTKNAAQQAAREKDTLKLISILGISLHAVQDFYSHSQWVETHPATSSTSFRADTWFSSPLPNNINLVTGIATSTYKGTPPSGLPKHGGYTNDPNCTSNCDLNKDSYVRPNWDKAYVFAYAASREWVNAVRTWVNEVDSTGNFWRSVQSYSVSGADRKDLDYDLDAVYRLSEWVKTSSDNGHWKGNGSGSTAEFATFAAAWTASHDSRFVKEFKVRGIQRLLINGLTGNGTTINPPPSAVPIIPKIALNQKAVIVKTINVKEDSVGFFELKIDPGGKADFYSKITVAGQTFIETMQLDKSNVSPAWTTIKFVPSTTTQVPIHYELWDEDGGVRGDDDHCDINPATGKRDLNFNFSVSSHNNTGDITGVHDSTASAVTSKGSGDKDRAILQFSITERSLF